MMYQITFVVLLVAAVHGQKSAVPVPVARIPLNYAQYNQPAVEYAGQPQYINQPVRYVQPAGTPAPVAYVEASPVNKPRYVPIAILRSASDSNYDGTFNYEYETENGISARANGQVKNFGTKEAAQVMEGSYSYTGPDGQPITLNWIADEFGFRAQGAHLPTPPPIPEAIARSLEYIRSLPPSKDDHNA